MLAALAALALYLASLGHGFVRDDVPLIVDNALMRAPDGLWRLLSGDFLAATGYSSGLWRPLPLLSFWIEGRLGGWEPTLFHATSIVLHAGCALLVGLLLVQAGVPRVPASLGAVWFATMPAHVEPVAWISGRADLLCAFFALLALWLDRRARDAGRAWPGWGAMAAFACALLSKEAAAGWAGVVLVAEWVRPRGVAGGRWTGVRWLAPYAAITVTWLIVHGAASGSGVLAPYVDEALRARRQAAGWVMLPQYLAFLWPWFPHSSDVPLALPARPLDGAVVAGALASTAALAVTGWLIFRRSRLAVPAAIVLVPVLPSITVALARAFISSGERMMFLPSAGIAWLAAQGLAVAWGRGRGTRAITGALTLLVILASAIETVRVQPMWRDDEHVFRGMTERHPDDPVGWVGLGEVLTLGGRKDEAEGALVRAAALGPGLPSVHLARAQLHYRSGEWERVIPHAGRALELDPRLFQARLFRASTLVRLGRPAEAVPDIEAMLRERPGDPSALMVEGQRQLAQGRPAEAIPPLAAAARAQPADAALWAALGAARAAAGDPAGARTDLERSLALDPGAPLVLRRLASVCLTLGDSAAAGAALERARALTAP